MLDCMFLENETRKSIGKKVYKTVDVLKFLSAFAVVCLHTRPFVDYSFDYIANTFFVMAVPFFFCTSSFFYHKTGGLLKFYIKRLLVLYMIWFFIEIPYVLDKFSFDSFGGWFFFFWSLLLQNTFMASWFLMALIEAMILVVLLEKCKSQILLYCFGFICFLLSLFASMYNGILLKFPYGIQIDDFLNHISAAQSFILAVPYCIMGKLILNAELKLKFKFEFLMMVILIFFAIVEALLCKNIYLRQNASLLIMPIVFFTVHLSLVYNININIKISTLMRKTSILIYLIHPIAKLILMNCFEIPLGLILTIYVAILSLSLSLLIVYLSNRLILLKYLY